VLAVINVAIRVEKFADLAADTAIKVALEDDARS